MDPASSSVAAELWRPPHHNHHHHPAASGPHHEASSAVTAADRSNGGRSSRGRRPRRDAPAAEEEPSKLIASTSGNAAASGGGGRDSADPEAKPLKKMTSSENNGKIRTEAETNSGNASKSVDKKPAPPGPPKQDYIHVRARRGEATDSHSLAERARREKISERMKVLQDFPGCNKVIGKASVLDEIINYIQSLQRQVEFLSLKLEAVNAHVNSASVPFPSKDFGAPAPPYNAAPGLSFDPQTPREYPQALTSDWLHMQIGNAYERVT